MISVRNLSKEYLIGQNTGYKSIRDSIASNPFAKREKQSFLALNDVSFNVKKGESLGIIGRNGAGKSTLLKILSKITFPSSGEIELEGKVASLLEVGTGFHPELTGRENIFFNGSLLGLTKNEINVNIESIIEFSGIERFIDTPLKRYSSGMRLRLAFAVASHLTAEILVIDEVLAVGDASFQKKCINKMDEVAHSGRTIIFVSHDLNAVKQLCSRSLVLEKGEVVFDGTTELAIETYIGLLEGNVEQEYDLTQIIRKTETDLIFSKVRFDKNEYKPGDSWLMELELINESGFDQTSLIFGVDIFNSYGVCVMHLSNMFLDTTNVSFQENKTYKFNIESLRIAPGNYYFDLFISAQGQTKDYIKNVGSFTVGEGNPYNYIGEIPIKGAYQPDYSFE